MSNPICKALAVQYPIIMGGMAGVGTARLAAAVSEAGGLGTGKSKFHYKVGDERYNSCFAAISTDGTGRFLFGTAWGVVRIQAGNR